MKVIYDAAKQKVPIKSWCENPEETALEQALVLANHPAVFRHVALMPDTHAGMGMPIGGVVALNNAISPNMVGVDIGCGMCSVNTGLKVEEVKYNLKYVVEKIKKLVPVGFSHRDHHGKDITYDDLSDLVGKYDMGHGTDLIGTISDRTDNRVSFPAVRAQIATLGGGNHFIEIQKDENDLVWVMVHSGSRNIGKQIADAYNKIAFRLNEKWHSNIPSKDLAFLPWDSDIGQEYFYAMNFALDFAYLNRQLMLQFIGDAFADHGLVWKVSGMINMINIHHNYASIENHFGKNVIIHRKGATLASNKTTGIIPGSMGTSSYIVNGLGCDESFKSCSHGAGRNMSRSKAKKTIKMEDFVNVMEGIEYEPVESNLDEAPQAYKDIDEVMEQQSDLVSIVRKLSPIAVIKG